jgi:hypothetical protein
LNRLLKPISLGAIGLLVGLMLAACTTQYYSTADGAPLARQITASGQCGVGSEGLTYLSKEDDLAQLGTWPMQNMSMKPLRALDYDREHLLIVGLGQKSTGGFGLTLANSRIVDNTLKLSFFLRRPPAGALVSQALTTPCAVLAITHEYWNNLEVNGNGLETLRLSRQRNR